MSVTDSCVVSSKIRVNGKGVGWGQGEGAGNSLLDWNSNMAILHPLMWYLPKTLPLIHVSLREAPWLCFQISAPLREVLPRVLAASHHPLASAPATKPISKRTPG